MQNRQRKVLRDNIQGISDGAITRLARRGGVKTMSHVCYEHCREILKVHLEKILRIAVAFTIQNHRMRVMEDDIRNAYKTLGMTLAFGNTRQIKNKRTGKINIENNGASKLCPKYGSNRSASGRFQVGGGDTQDPLEDAEYSDPEDFDSEQSGGDEAVKRARKPHRFKAGTVALREIRTYQKQPNSCLLIGKLPFERLVREVAQDFKSNLQFSPEAVYLLQVETEQYLSKLFASAQLCVVNAKAIRVLPTHIQLSRRLTKV
jgi:histone H3/H4